MVGAAIVVAVVAHIRRSRENKEPIQLGVGKKAPFLRTRDQKEEIVILRRSFSDWRCTATARWRRLLSRRRPWHFRFRVQQKSGTAAMSVPEVEVATVEQRDVPVFKRMGSDVGRIRERPDPTTGLQATSSGKTTQKVRSFVRAKYCAK